MNHHDELAKRISLVRRDLGNLLFHFTRKPEHDIEVIHGTGKTIMGDHASSVLHKILMEGKFLAHHIGYGVGTNVSVLANHP